MDAFEIFLESSKAIGASHEIHDGDDLLIPPSSDFGYESTPSNSLTFASMGCDGVHFALITEKERRKESSPVVMICPMDSEDICFLAETFREYLAVGCGVPEKTIEKLLEEEERSAGSFAAFLKRSFSRDRLIDDERISSLNAKLMIRVKRKAEPVGGANSDSAPVVPPSAPSE